MKQIKLKISIIILIVLILNSTLVFGVENYMNFISLEGEQEFSQNIVKTILQDSKGYMWFGTNDGLSKYDGYKTQNYRQTPFGENTLRDNYIIDLVEDDDENIWIGTSKGLTKLDPSKDTFTHYIHDKSSAKSMSSDKISVILKDKDDNLWVGTSDRGLNKYDKKKDVFVPYNLNLTSQKITSIYEDNKGYLWIGTEKGLNKVNTKTKKVIKYKNDENNINSISGNHITAICQDRHGDIWIGTKNNGLSKINLEKNEINRYLKDESDSYSIGSNIITSIIEDKNGTLWIGSKQGGLARYDRKTGFFVKRASDAKNIQSNRQNNILTLYQDDTGLIWVGIEYGGVNKFNPLASFQNYTTVGVFENSMNDNNILSIYKDSEGIIWAGTKNGGVNKLDLDRRTVKYYTHKVDDKNTISSDSVKYILEDSNGLMWFGTEMGLNILDKKTNKIKRYIYTEDESSISNNHIEYIFEDHRGDIWIGTEAGLDKYDSINDKFINYNRDNSNISGNHVTTIFEDIDNNLWIGTFHDGLNKFDRDEKNFISYRNNPEDKTTISNDQVKSIVEDNDGNLWIGTSNGLNKFDRKTKKFKVFTESNHLKSNFISGILKHKDYLWISSNNGIPKFDIKEEKIINNYSAIDGLQGNYFNSGSIYKSKDGQLLFGGTEGFNTIYPDSEQERYHVPSILLSDFRVNDKQVDINDGKIILPYDKNRIYFEFGVIDYKKPDNNRHYFKLEGYEEFWNNVKDRNYGVYNNLQPGNYTLKIKGVNSEGIWAEQNVEIDIKIKPPFWKTFWAYIIYSLIGILLIYLLFNYVQLLEKMINDRTQELNKANKKLLEEISQRKKTEEILKSTMEEKQRLFEEKMEIENFRNDFFVNLSHELRTPLNMIVSTIQLSEMYLKNDKLENVVEKIKDHFKLVKTNCYRLLKTVNNIIDVSKIESKQYELNMKLINIIYFLEDVVDSTIEYAKDKNIDIIFDTQTEEEIVKCDPVEIERVIINIIANAIKYNYGKGHIWVDAYRKDENIEIVIKDDGVGIPEEKQKLIFKRFKRVNEQEKLGSGIGLSLSKLLIDMHGGTIEFNSKEGVGSEFVIKLPVYNVENGEYEDIVDLETLKKESMDLEIEMSEIK